jgi:4,5-dihydroxyphthalate decarboxylase
VAPLPNRCQSNPAERKGETVTRITLTLAAAPSDRIMPLVDGRVPVRGIELVYLPQLVEETFWRMARFQEYDVAEFSLSSYLIARDRGTPRLIALPVFPSRMFRHSAIYINTRAGITQPRDLIGRRVGIPEYQLTALLWIRGILSDEYGVLPEDIEWFIGGEERPGRQEKLPVDPPPRVRIRPIPPGTTLNQLLVEGELDALIAPRAPSAFLAGNPAVARLFPDYPAVEAEYYQRTKIFPIMHVVVLREEVLERYPWVARNLYEAFEAARRTTLVELHQTAALAVMLPWLHRELDRTRAILGEDYWPYGLEANRHVLETAIRYAHEQGLIRRRFALEELFAPSTIEEFVI